MVMGFIVWGVGFRVKSVAAHPVVSVKLLVERRTLLAIVKQSCSNFRGEERSHSI
jgi:hypothetical protein